MWDPLGPFHQGEELLVCRLADISDWIVGLWRSTGTKEHHINTLSKIEARNGDYEETNRPPRLLRTCWQTAPTLESLGCAVGLGLVCICVQIAVTNRAKAFLWQLLMWICMCVCEAWELMSNLLHAGRRKQQWICPSLSGNTCREAALKTHRVQPSISCRKLGRTERRSTRSQLEGSSEQTRQEKLHSARQFINSEDQLLSQAEVSTLLTRKSSQADQSASGRDGMDVYFSFSGGGKKKLALVSRQQKRKKKKKEIK